MSLVGMMQFVTMLDRPLIGTCSLKSRHIQFIALGGTIGTGLFLGIGRAFAQAGPLSLLLGYTFTGVAIFAMVRRSARGGSTARWVNNLTQWADAIAGRNGHLVTIAGRNPAVLRALCGRSNGVRGGMERGFCFPDMYPACG